MGAESRLRVPDAPHLRGSLRAAGGDFYFNSPRLVAANVAWGAGLLLLAFAPVPLLIAVPLIALLAVPTGGIYRLAALIVRGEPATVSNVFDAYRNFLGPTLLMGLAAVFTGTVFIVNLVNGFATGSMIGWAFATVAGWSLVILVTGMVVAWPIVVDPVRSDEPLRRRLRLAAILLLAYPVRMGALTAVIALIIVVSTVLFAALLTISVSFVALLSCRYILPAADRFEGRATYAIPD